MNFIDVITCSFNKLENLFFQIEIGNLKYK